MARNSEIKAHVDNYQSIYELASKLSGHKPTVILQDDTFFNCNNGRLKLRVFADKKGELIFYQRPNQQGPKESFYVLSPTDSPESLKESLTLAYGVMGEVKKKRMLFLVGRTRIHLDQVEGLGDFLELEVVLEDNESAKTGEAEADKLLNELGIDSSKLIGDAYVDLIARMND